MGWLDLQGIGVQLVMIQTGQLLTSSAGGTTSGLPTWGPGDGSESATSGQPGPESGQPTSTAHGTMPQNGLEPPKPPEIAQKRPK